MHWKRWRKWGDPLIKRPVRSVEDRFWSKVSKNPGEGCWEWTAGTWQAFGYGKFQAGSSRDDNRAVYAHRFAWEMEHGPLPADVQVCHHCDNPLCVRLSHLFLGTQLDNIRDMYAKHREARPDIERPIPRGVEHGMHVLDDELVREIRRLAASGVPVMSLARQLGINHYTARDVLNGRTWRHVT